MEVLISCFFVLLIAGLLILIGKFSYKHAPKRLPGPWCLPIIGYPFLFTKSCHVKLGELADIYGDILQIYIGGKLVIVLSSLDAAKQAFSKLELSGRPSFKSLAVFHNEVKGEFAFTSFSDGCIFLRKAVIRSLGRLFHSRKDRVETAILAAHDSLKQQLLENEGSITDPDKLIHKTIISIIGPLSLGSELNCKDPIFDQLLNASENFNKVMKFNFVANYFPFLPSVMWREFKVFRENNSKLGRFMEETVRSHKSNSTLEDLQDALEFEGEECNQEELKRLGLNLLSLKLSATNIFGAGVFTTAESYLWALRLLSVFPEAQEKIAKEIDSLSCTGHFDGVVTLEHRKHLTYTNAFLEEVFRFSSSVPLGIPHSAMKTSKLRGYDIPEGSIVVANLWKINRDPKYFDQPEKFMPERFIQEDGSFNDGLTTKVAAFSVGKRKCIGETVARQELFLLITNLVSVFNVRLVGLVHGGSDFLQPTDGFTVKPLPALYTFSLRSKKQKS